jgi:hypothetical protein
MNHLGGNKRTFNQRIWWHICKTAQAKAKTKFCKRATLPIHKDTATWTDNNSTEKKHEPVTACKQYYLAAGATQGNIAYTQNVMGKFMKRQPNGN